MFHEVTYDENRNIYQSIYKATDERTAKWIANQYENIALKEESLTTIFAYKRDVVLNSKSEEATNDLRDKLNHELAAIMAGVQEIDPDYRVKEHISCEVNNVQLSKR